MNLLEVLEVFADLATIVTGIVAATFGVRAVYRGRRRRIKLEEHLKRILEHDLALGRNGRRTPLRLSADLGMTVPEVLEAAFDSDKIKPSPAINPKTKRASAIFLKYDPS
jgi:hypothetical protein